MAKKEAGFSTWLQRVRRTGEFSDVKVCVNGEEFHLHMLPLLNASAYFRNLPSTSNGSPPPSSSPHSAQHGCCRIINIPDLPGGVEGFSAIADFCYLLKPNFTLENVAPIRAAAEFLGVMEVLESSKKFLYVNVFVQWQASISFLQQYRRLSSPVDEYVETRCLKVIVAACAKAFGETKYLTAPILFLANRTPENNHHRHTTSSQCQTLTEILVHMSSLPDAYASEAIEALVDAKVNLNLKCRQSRNVRSWLNSLIDNDCQTDRARCWVVLCLSHMLIKGAPANRPWMELSSQYWCTLLEHVDHLMTMVDEVMKVRLADVKKVLEHRIGVGMEELDDYLHCYRFVPETLMSMIGYYVNEADPDPESLDEVAGEVDGFLWNFAETGSIAPDVFLSLFKAFPASCRQSHDTTYGSIEKLLAKRPDCTPEDKQQLWRLVDPSKLSPAVNEAALSNPGFLSQPHILESVLQHHSEELSKLDDNDGRNLRHIMQKVINASLKLLEENSRRSKEIVELQKQYAALLGGKLQDSSESSPDPFWRSNVQSHHRLFMNKNVTEVPEISEAPSTATVSSIHGEYAARMLIHTQLKTSTLLDSHNVLQLHQNCHFKYDEASNTLWGPRLTQLTFPLKV